MPSRSYMVIQLKCTSPVDSFSKRKYFYSLVGIPRAVDIMTHFSRFLSRNVL